MRRLVIAGLIATGSMSNAGCATIAHGTGQDVTITSDPIGARVTILTRERDGSMTTKLSAAQTPVVVSLPRRASNIVVRVQTEGCPYVEIPLKRSVSGWVAGNLIVANPLSMQGMSNPSTDYPRQLAIGLPVMFGVDALTGGAYKLPKRVHAPLCGR